MEEREDVASAVVDASAAFVGVDGTRAGVRLSHYATSNHNLPCDLLGSESLADGYNLYDYSVTHSGWELYLTHHTTADWGSLSLAAEFGGVGLSYRSATSGRKTTTSEHLTVDMVARWSCQLGEGMLVGSNVAYSCKPPHWKELFGSPEGAMTRNPYAKSAHSGSAELWGRYTSGRIMLHSTLFARYEGSESRVEHFWNDFAGCYSALLAGGLNSFAYGVELSARVDICKGLSATLHTSLLSSRYVSDAVGDVVSYYEGRAFATATPLRIKGVVDTSSPLSASGLDVRYRTPYGWVVGGEWSLVAERYMEPSLFLCSDVVQERDLSPEVRERVTTPHNLGTAHSLSLFAYRNVGKATVSLSVGNLLNQTDGYYDGYQPSRVKISESNTAITYEPHAPRYQHIYPRYFLMSIGYEF